MGIPIPGKMFFILKQNPVIFFHNIFLHLQDVIGKRGYLALACSLLTVPVFGLLAFTHVHPLVSTLWLGFTYSFAAVRQILIYRLLIYRLWNSFEFRTQVDLSCLTDHCLGGKLWYLQHNCFGDTIVYHLASEIVVIIPGMCLYCIENLFSTLTFVVLNLQLCHENNHQPLWYKTHLRRAIKLLITPM